MASEIRACREALQMLLAIENYQPEEFASLWQNYQHALLRYCEGTARAEEAVLEAELDWVQQVIVQVEQERQTIGGQLITLSQGRKAIDNYSNF